MSDTIVSPFDAWSIYMAINLHFKENSKYDAFKFNFKGPRCKREKFMGDRNKYTYEKLAKKYPKKQALIDYYLGNVVSGNTWIQNMNDETYNVWAGKIQSMQYRFKNEMACFLDECEKKGYTFDSAIIPPDPNDMPLIYTLAQQNKISIESLAILHNLLGYANDINKNLNDPLGVLSSMSNLVIKYEPFLRKNLVQKQYKNIVLNLFTHANK